MYLQIFRIGLCTRALGGLINIGLFSQYSHTITTGESQYVFQVDYKILINASGPNTAEKID